MAAKGASAIDLQQRAGEAMVQEAESGRQATMLGVQYGQAAGANKNYQQQLLNQKNANNSANQMMMSSMGTLAGVAEGIDWQGGGSNDIYNPEQDFVYPKKKNQTYSFHTDAD